MLEISRRIILWTMVAPASRLLTGGNLPAAPRSSPQQALTLDMIRERLDRAYRALSSYSAEVWTASSPTAASARPLANSGRANLRVIRSGTDAVEFRFALDFTSAPATMIRADQKAVRILQPASRRLLEGSLEEAQARFLKPYVEFVTGQSKMAYLKTEPVDGQDAALLEMTPDPGIDSPIQQVRVWIGLKADLPVRFDVKYRVSALTVELRKPRINDKFPDSVFDLRVPDGIKPTRIATE